MRKTTEKLKKNASSRFSSQYKTIWSAGIYAHYVAKTRQKEYKQGRREESRQECLICIPAVSLLWQFVTIEGSFSPNQKCRPWLYLVMKLKTRTIERNPRRLERLPMS